MDFRTSFKTERKKNIHAEVGGNGPVNMTHIHTWTLIELRGGWEALSFHLSRKKKYSLLLTT